MLRASLMAVLFPVRIEQHMHSLCQFSRLHALLGRDGVPWVCPLPTHSIDLALYSTGGGEGEGG